MFQFYLLGTRSLDQDIYIIMPFPICPSNSRGLLTPLIQYVPPACNPTKCMFAFMHACICGDVMQQCPEVDNTHLVYICGFVPKAFFGPPLCLLRLKDCAPASYLILGFIDPSYTAPLLHTVTYFCSLCLSFWVGSLSKEM